MASQHQVKQYLAYWFQLGKKVLVHNGREELLPHPVIAGDRYSLQFEAYWQQILANASDCHLEGTHQTIGELLTSGWDINPCSRCAMPVPVASLGMPALACPCNDLPFWPDSEAPQPRSPINSQAHLVQIRDRLIETSKNPNSH